MVEIAALQAQMAKFSATLSEPVGMDLDREKVKRPRPEELGSGLLPFRGWRRRRAGGSGYDAPITIVFRDNAPVAPAKLH